MLNSKTLSTNSDMGSVSRYWDAVAFARKTLGDDVTLTCCEDLKRLARTNTLEEIEAIVVSWIPREKVERIEKALKTGANFRVPDHLWDKKANYVEDAVGEGWAKLFDAGFATVDEKQANVVGQTTARTLVRKERRYAPLPGGDAEDGEDGEDGEGGQQPSGRDIPEGSQATALADDSGDEWWEKIARGIRREKQIEIIRALGEDDFRFLIQYLAGFRRRRANRRDRDRAATLKAKLQRHFKKSVGD